MKAVPTALRQRPPPIAARARGAGTGAGGVRVAFWWTDEQWVLADPEQ